jgi:hypothetical protein
MTLLEAQKIFSINLSKLIMYINAQGYTCTLGEVARSHEQAEIFAKQGKGIKNSLHCVRLAADINLFSGDGQYLKDSDEYKKFGDYWKALHPKNRFGGDFPKPDGNHFQMNLS